jgi:hypothetical protein
MPVADAIHTITADFGCGFLVTEELLVEAHSAPQKPWVTSLFFVGFLMILLLDELAP